MTLVETHLPSGEKRIIGLRCTQFLRKILALKGIGTRAFAAGKSSFDFAPKTDFSMP